MSAPLATEATQLAQPAVRRRTYGRYVLSKVLGALGSLVFVIVVNFFLFRVLPGDPASVLGRDRLKTPQQRADFRAEYGLDQSLPHQFLTYLQNTFTGHLGDSIRYRKPVSELIIDRLPTTLLLVGVSTLLAMLIGVAIGVVAAWHRGKTFDRASTGFTLTLYSMPEWWLGLLLIAVFAVGVGGVDGFFPTGQLHSGEYGENSPITLGYLGDMAKHLALPVVTLTLAYLAEYSLVMRSSLLDEIGEDYLTTARAKGLRDVVVRRRHAVRNALLPTATVSALSFGFVVSGAITVETVFSIPGLGLLSTEALTGPDYWVLQGTFLVAAGGIIVANLLINLLYGLLDPRVRT